MGNGQDQRRKKAKSKSGSKKLKEAYGQKPLTSKQLEEKAIEAGKQLSSLLTNSLSDLKPLEQFLPATTTRSGKRESEQLKKFVQELINDHSLKQANKDRLSKTYRAIKPDQDELFSTHLVISVMSGMLEGIRGPRLANLPAKLELIVSAMSATRLPTQMVGYSQDAVICQHPSNAMGLYAPNRGRSIGRSAHNFEDRMRYQTALRALQNTAASPLSRLLLGIQAAINFTLSNFTVALADPDNFFMTRLENTAMNSLVAAAYNGYREGMKELADSMSEAMGKTVNAQYGYVHRVSTKGYNLNSDRHSPYRQLDRADQADARPSTSQPTARGRLADNQNSNATNESIDDSTSQSVSDALRQIPSGNNSQQDDNLADSEVAEIFAHSLSNRPSLTDGEKPEPSAAARKRLKRKYSEQDKPEQSITDQLNEAPLPPQTEPVRAEQSTLDLLKGAVSPPKTELGGATTEETAADALVELAAV